MILPVKVANRRAAVGFKPLGLVVPPLLGCPIGVGHPALADQVQAVPADAPLGVGAEAFGDAERPG